MQNYAMILLQEEKLSIGEGEGEINYNNYSLFSLCSYAVLSMITTISFLL